MTDRERVDAYVRRMHRLSNFLLGVAATGAAFLIFTI